MPKQGQTHTHAQPKLYNRKSNHPEKYFRWNCALKLCVDFAIVVVGGGVFTSLWNIKRINFMRANDKNRVKNGVRKILTTNLKLGISLCTGFFQTKHEARAYISPYGWRKRNETYGKHIPMNVWILFYFIFHFIQGIRRDWANRAGSQASKRSKGICGKHWFAM